jgi:NitT/TauT family transport system ATP-binding protein
MKLVLTDVSKSYSDGNGGSVDILSGVSFEVQSGESVVLHGANGCGKSTLANIMAGLDEPTAGTLSVINASHDPHSVGYVFQDYGRSLLPWFSVLQNIGVPLRLNGVSREECQEQVLELIKRTELGPLPLDRYPYELSGGQQQRACILRALLASGEFLILDEPFSSLDQKSNLALQKLVQDIRLDGQMLILSIIHDLDDAIFLADRVVCLGNSPTRIVADISVPIPWPRDQQIKISEPFLEVRRQVIQAMGVLHGQAR